MSRFAITALVSLCLLAVSACAQGPQIRFADDAKVYTLAEVERNAATVSVGSASSVTVADAAEVRQRVLARLRQEGSTAGKAADFMTTQFPVETKAVPYFVEAATVDGKAAWIIVEAWGGRTGALVYRRLWVFGRDGGEVLGARTYR